MVIGFCFIGVDATLSDACGDLITLAQFPGSEMSRGLLQDIMDVYVRP